MDELGLLRALMAWDPPVWIFGGFAEDAVLAGRRTRPHEDVDVLVVREDLDLRLAQARALGFRRWHLRFAVFRDKPLVIGSIANGLNLEIVVFDRDEEGRIYWEMPARDGLARLYLPDDALGAPPSDLEGVPVRTVSPLALHQIRAGVADLFGGMRPKDVVSQAKLRARFFEGVPEERLAPRVEPVVEPHAHAAAPRGGAG